MSISLTFSERREFSVYTATDRKLTVYCGDVLKFLPALPANSMQYGTVVLSMIAINVECDFFWGVVEQLYRMRHRGIPAALCCVLLPLPSVLLLVAARKDYNEALKRDEAAA